MRPSILVICALLATRICGATDWICLDGGVFRMGGLLTDVRATRLGTGLRRETAIQPFCIARDLVTIREFVCFMNATTYPVESLFVTQDSRPKEIVGVKRPFSVAREAENLPVYGISWSGAKWYCNWRSAVEGCQVRLPTEAEFEFLMTNGGKTRFPWGDEARREANTWTGNPSDLTTGSIVVLFGLPVGTHPYNANHVGVRDLIGSVEQWCEDRGKTDGYRVVKGGFTAPGNPLLLGGNVVPRGYTRKELPENNQRMSGPVPVGFRVARTL